jgi:hypothetical protein
MRVDSETLIRDPAFAMIAMTVHMNDGRTSEGTDLIDDWDISDSELLSALRDHNKQRLVRKHNNLADDHEDLDRVETAQELVDTKAPVRDMIEHDLERDLCDVAVEALDNREAEYIVGVDRTSMANFYTVTVLTE